MSKLSIKAVEKVQRKEQSVEKAEIEIFPVEEEKEEEEVEAEEAGVEAGIEEKKMWVIVVDHKPNKTILNNLPNSIEFKSSLGHNRNIIELQKKNINTIFICLDSKVNVAWLRRNLTLYRSKICLVVTYSKIRSKQQKYINDLSDCDFKVKTEDLNSTSDWIGESEFYEAVKEASYIIHQSISLCSRIFGSSKLRKKKKKCV